MNRKLLSLVLAAVFTVSLGTNGLASTTYNNYSNSYNDSYGARNANAYTVSVASNGSEDRTSEERTGFQIEIPDANTTLGGNLTAVFKYNGGTLIGVEQADGTFQLYDSYGARFTVNNAGGIWTVTNVNLRTSDLAEMETAGSAENFLRSMGFTNQFLGVADMNDTTTETTYNADSEQNETAVTSVTGASLSISSGWWQLAIDTLKQGANHSISISEGTAATGPTLTVLENGKQMASYATDYTTSSASPYSSGSYSGVRQTAQYYYDNHGFMTGYSQATMEMDETDNGTASGKWIMNVTKITYNEDGVRKDTTYKLFDWNNDPMTLVNNPNSALAKGGEEVTASHVGQEQSVTYYSANNSALYSYDFTTNNTTYFANNRQSYVKNETGTTIGLYEYTDNGVISAYFNANGTAEGSDSKVGTTTFFDRWGRQLFTATGGGIDDPTGKNAFINTSYRAELMSQYYDIVLGNVDYKDLTADFELSTANGKREFVAKEGTGTAISSFNIYTDQLFKGDQYRTNGFLDMNKVWNAMYGISGNSFGSEILNNVNVGTEAAVVEAAKLLDQLNAAADSIENSGLNGANNATQAAGVADDESNMNAIDSYLTQIDASISAIKTELDNEIAKGANADKSKVEKLASIYSAICKTASEMYDRAESIAGIAAYRKNRNARDGAISVSAETLAKFGTFSFSNGDVKISGNNNIKSRREAASERALTASSYAQNAYTNRTGNNATVLANKLSGLNTKGVYNLGYTASDIFKMLKYSHGGKTALASTSIAMSSWDGDNIPKNANTSDVEYTSNSTQNITGSSQNSHVQWSTRDKSTNSSITAAGVTFTNTIMFGGAQAYQTQCHMVTNIYEDIVEQVSTESDPAVAGTFLGTTTIDGRTYAMVGDASINIMDGEDFHALGDEVIYIDITDNQDAVKGAKKGDNVMFMGDVSKDKADGHFVVTMNTNYGTGYMNFGSDVEAMETAKDKISEIARVSIVDRAEADRLYKEAIDDGILADSGYNWIVQNTETNVDKLAAGDFTWDNKNDAGSIQKNLEEAWKLLF